MGPRHGARSGTDDEGDLHGIVRGRAAELHRHDRGIALLHHLIEQEVRRGCARVIVLDDDGKTRAGPGQVIRALLQREDERLIALLFYNVADGEGLKTERISHAEVRCTDLIARGVARYLEKNNKDKNKKTIRQG